MICLSAHATTIAANSGTVECAIMLPCEHHVGRECIQEWKIPVQSHWAIFCEM